jgi:hypothetical protein
MPLLQCGVRTLEDWTKGCPETSVTNYQPILHNIIKQEKGLNYNVVEASRTLEDKTNRLS